MKDVKCFDGGGVGHKRITCPHRPAERRPPGKWGAGKPEGGEEHHQTDRLVVVTLSDVLGASKFENLTAKAGDEITLQTGVTGLKGDYSVSWYWGTSKETLVHCDKGEIDMKLRTPERFEGRLHLDKTTGCLTIQNLSIEDNGVYQVDIIDNNNNKRPVHHYTVTVSEAAGSSPDAAAAQKNHMAVVLTVLLSVAVCIELFT